MIRRSSVVVLAALSAGVAAAAWQTVGALRDPPSVTSRKLAEAERITYYRISHDGGPRFLLSGAETTLRLVTHVRLPPDTPYDPLRRIRYGIRVRVHGDHFAWEREVFTQSRQSKALCVRDAVLEATPDPCTVTPDVDQLDFADTECEGGRWRCENAFTRDDGVQLSDERLLYVHLPDDVPSDAVLSITLIGDVTEGMVRVYNQVERSDGARERAARVLAPTRQRQAVWTTTYVPWSLVPISEREGRMRHRHERMSAIGEDGVDYHTRVVYFTGFRLPLDLLTENEAVPVHHQRYAAFNVVGPAELTLLVDTYPSGEDAPDDARVDLDWVSAWIIPPPGASSAPDGPAPVVRPRRPPPPPRASAGIGVHKLPIPAGVHTLHVRTHSVRPLGVQLLGPRRSSFGAPADVGDQRGRIRPDEIRIPAFVSDPDQESIAALGSGDEDPMSRVVRIEVRWIDDASAPSAGPAPAPAPAPPGGAELGVVGTAADLAHAEADADTATTPDTDAFTGELIVALEGTGEVMRQVISGVRAPYEWMDRTGHPPAAVSEPIEVDLIVPEHITSVRVSTSRTAAVRLFRYLPVEMVYELPYRAVDVVDARWRYARIERRTWWPMSPINQDALADHDRLATLVAQARLEDLGVRYPYSHGGSVDADDRDPEMSSATGDGRAPGQHTSIAGVPVEPLDDPERHQVLEPADDARDRWTAGMVSAVPLGRGVRYRFDAGEAQRAKIYYWLAAADLGADITLQVDGDRALTWSPATTHGYYELPLLAPGVHTLTATAGAPSLSLYISRPAVEAGVSRYAMRWVHSLGTGHLRLRVVKHAGRPITINAVLYAPWQDASPEIAIRAVISGGRPLRTPGLWPSKITTADRRVPIPSAQRAFPIAFTDRESGAAGYSRTIPIRLGDDIQPGTHYIDVYTNYGGRLWARFFINTERDPRDRALQWRFRAP